MSDQQFVILGLDGLRADMVTPDLTPNLLRLARQGVFFRRHHAVFPTATRVNVASLVTGAHAGTHGIVNNSIFEPGVSPDQPVDLGKYDRVEAADAYYGGKLLHTPSLGEILAAQGDTLLAVSAGTTGSNRLMHHKVKSVGGLAFSAHGLEPSYPAGEAAAIHARYGHPPAPGTPDASRLQYLTEVFLDYLWPRFQPRVTILWFSDPDKTYHYRGIGSPESLAAIRAADTQLGRLMAWAEAAPQGERVNLLVISDHGHVTVRRQVSVQQALIREGIPAGHGTFGAADVAVVPWCAGSIHVRHHDPALIQRIATWMLEQPWCGSVFTQGKNDVEGIVPGTFSRALVRDDHPRAGDILYVMRADNETDEHGIVGGCVDDSQLPLGGGTHGGLTPHELRNVCVAFGPAFRQPLQTYMPSGTIDVMPTLLHILGYDIPPRVDGRVLHEVLTNATPRVEPLVETQTFSTGTSEAGRSYQQHLRVSRVDETVYLDCGWVD